MKATIENFADFLNQIVKPSIDFVKSPTAPDPVIRLSFMKKSLLIECASGEKNISISLDAKVYSTGEMFLLASSISNIKSSHKKATLLGSNKQLVVTSGNSERRLTLKLDTVGPETYPAMDDKKKKEPESIGTIPLANLREAISKISIVPIIMPGAETSLMSIAKGNEHPSIIVQDGLRIAALVLPEGTIKLKEALVTDFKDLTRMISVLASSSETASILASKKFIEAVGMDENKKEKIRVRTQHNIPNIEIIHRSRNIAKDSLAKKPIMSFLLNPVFKESLENVIAVTSAKTQGYVDISVSSKSITIHGSGPAASYKETVAVKKSKGSGVVRIGTQVIPDVLRLLSPTSIVKVNNNSLVITSKWDNDYVAHFILPFMGFEKLKKSKQD